MKLPVIKFFLKITRSEKGDENHCVKTGIWSYRMYLIRNNWTYISNLRECASCLSKNNIYVSEMNALIGYLQNLTWEINETLSILRWWVKINVTCSIVYETENDLLVRAGKATPFICHCATVQVWFTPPVSFFIHYLLEMTIGLVLTSDWLKVSLVTLEIVYIWGRRFTYSHCSLTNWENTSPVKFFNLLPCTPCKFWKLCITNMWECINPVRVRPK